MPPASSARGAATAVQSPVGPDEQAQSELEALRDLLDADPVSLEAAGLPIPPPDDLVIAVIVSHNGSTWLPESLAGIAAQTRPPDLIVAIDTGSTDGSLALLRAELGAERVRSAKPTTGFGAAVALALSGESIPKLPGASELAAGANPGWIWLLHDDCAPEPTALEELLRASVTMRNVGLLGPKARDWHDPRLLVEVGITVDRGGRRVTGLEAGEFDQGQHDGQRDVLAVPTAAALIRRDTWEAVGGLDPALTLFRDDIDLGWRVTRAGRRVVVVPTAIVRHARAAATGRRHADAAPGIARRVDRRHALLVSLANASAIGLVLGLPRAVLVGTLRALGYLLTRRPHLAADEMAAVTVALLPGRLVAARRWRRAHRSVGASSGAAAVRSLMAPRGARVMAGVGIVGDWIASGSAQPVTAAAVGETGPVSEESEELLPADDIGRLRRFLTRPWLLLTLGSTVLALIAERRLLSGGDLIGGRLLPSSISARVLWRDYASTWHLGTLAGSPTPSPPWTPLVALAGSICDGHVSVAIGLVLLLAVPLSILSAYAATRPLPGTTALATPARIWAALTYGLIPVATGAVAGGRFDVAVSLIGLPLLFRGCTALIISSRRRRAWRRAWSLGLGLAVVAAFTPQVWTLAAVALALAAIVRLLTGSPKAFVRLLTPLVPTPALLLPWLPRLGADPGVLLTGLGRPGGLAGQPAALAPRGSQLLAFTPSSGGGYPGYWWLLPVLLLALTGLVSTQPRRRLAVTACWSAGLLGLAGSVAVAHTRVTSSPVPQVGWPGPTLGLAAVALLAAGLIATGNLRSRLAARAFGLRQVAAVLLVIIAVPVPVALGLRWAIHGAGGTLTRRDIGLLPPDVLSDARTGGPGQRVLVLRRNTGGSISWSLGRLDGPRLGDEEQLPDPRSVTLVNAVVRDLATARGTDAAELLSTFNVHVIAALGSRRTALTEALDTQPALSRRATGGYDLSLWQLTVPTSRAQILDPVLAAAALHPASLDAGVGRGPSQSLLSSDPPQVVGAGDEGLDAHLASGQGGRLLVLSDAADPGWRATVNNQPLTPVTVWGWAQAFQLPAQGGQLKVFRDASNRHLLIVLQAISLGIVLIFAAPSLGRDRTGTDGVDDPVGPGRKGRRRSGDAESGADADDDEDAEDRFVRLRRGRLA